MMTMHGGTKTGKRKEVFGQDQSPGKIKIGSDRFMGRGCWEISAGRENLGGNEYLLLWVHEREGKRFPSTQGKKVEKGRGRVESVNREKRLLLKVFRIRDPCRCGSTNAKEVAAGKMSKWRKRGEPQEGVGFFGFLVPQSQHNVQERWKWKPGGARWIP